MKSVKPVVCSLAFVIFISLLAFYGLNARSSEKGFGRLADV